MERPEGSDEMPPGVSQPQSSSPPPPKPAPKKEEPPKKQEPQLDPEEAKAKKEADDLKAQGNAAYKQRKFDEAIPLYEKAWETYPKDIAYLTNLSAVYFEMGDYDKAIEVAQKAVDQAFELHADFKAVAKAYGRIGTSYAKKGDLDNAIKFYNKSLTEHRTPDVLTKLREAEKTKLENEKKAYIDPEKAEAAREEGNTAFKAGQYADAVKHYTEAIKRLPSDPRGYTNRSAAYTKLMALPEALKDANDAIKQDPDFVKAYIRKALVQNGMKENTSALETLQKAMDVDKEHKHQREIESNMNKIMNEIQAERANETDEQTYERAMRDPEVQEIMSDPVMRQILSDAQQNPRALMDHMKNPMVSRTVVWMRSGTDTCRSRTRSRSSSTRASFVRGKRSSSSSSVSVFIMHCKRSSSPHIGIDDTDVSPRVNLCTHRRPSVHTCTCVCMYSATTPISKIDI